MDDTIYRQAAIDALHRAIIDFFDICDDDEESPITYKDEQLLEINKAISCRIKQLPSAQPEQRWIPVKTRPMDEEERKEWSEKVGYELEGDDAVIYTSQLPDDGQECIVCTKWGNVFIDTFQNDPDYGCAFEEHGDMDGITAWMPLPKPWKGESDE